MRPLLLLKGRRFCRLLLTAFIIFFVCSISSAQASGRGVESTVTFKGRDVPLSDLFKAIKKQTGYTVMYSLSVTQLDGKEKVTVNFNKAGIVEVMAYVLKGRNLVWTIVDESILIYREDEVKKNTGPPVGVNEKSDTLINAVLPMVVGKVTDAEDKPIPGATVMVKGTREGAITDGDGVFSLSNVNVNTQIIVTSLGYKPREIMVKGRTIQVKMNLAVSDLDETQIIGYGTTTRRFSTGSITTVTAKEIEKQPVPNVLSALQGQVPGLIVTPTSGYASAPFRVEIRGRSVINPKLSNEPLYVIDGVPLTILALGPSEGYGHSNGLLQNGFDGPATGQSPLFSINPSDIESVTVLKDADATAIYGSRGANGVIIITTKKGKIGKTKLNVDAYSGVSVVTGRYKLLNTQQYLNMRKEAFRNDGITPDVGNAYDLVTFDTTRYTNWQDVFWDGVARTFDLEASLSGGDNQNTFRIGGGYHRETSIFTRSGADQRGSIQFNLTHKTANQRFKLSLTSTYTYAKSDMLNLPAASILLPPNGPDIFNSSGSLNFSGWQPVSDFVSGFGSLYQPYTAKTGFLNSQLAVQYQLLKGLNFSGQLGYSTFHNSQIMTFPKSSLDPSYDPTGTSQFGNNNGSNIIIEPQVEYKSVFGKINLNALVGASLQAVSQDGNTISGTGYVNDNLLRSISNAPIKNAEDVSGQYKYVAAFGRLNLNLLSKYILNISLRRDGSSRFGPGKQFGNFGAIGAAYIFSEEKWWKNRLSFITFGKVRASYGVTGSDLIGDYQYLSRWSESSTFPYQNTASYSPLGLANPDLQWQVNHKIEGAMEFGFFNDQILVELVWYRNRCGNQLLNYNLPRVTGFGSIATNLNATVENTGTEAILKARLIARKDFEWSFRFNIGANRNKLVAFPGLEKTPYASAFTIGQPLNIRKMAHLVGVDEQTGKYIYFDKNHDGEINISPNDIANDLYSKDLSVKFDGGAQTELRYKGLQISVFFIFRKQILPSAIYSTIPGTIGNQSNQSIEVLNHWQNPGDKAKFARYTTTPETSDYLFGSSDGVYSDGSYIRLRNVSLSYDFAEQFNKRFRLNSFRVYMRAQNLFVLSKYVGVDPDAPGLGALPPARIITAGIQLNF